MKFNIIHVYQALGNLLKQLIKLQLNMKSLNSVNLAQLSGPLKEITDTL